jgi:hypothetical protein
MLDFIKTLFSNLFSSSRRENCICKACNPLYVDVNPECPVHGAWIDDDEKEDANLNWMGTDDVPRPPDGIITFSEGRASKAYIEAKDRDIQAALDVVMQAISANSPEHHMSVLKAIHAHLMRALL